MKTKRAQTFTLAFLASSLALSGIAGAFDPAVPTHPRTTRESVSSTGIPAVGVVGAGTLSANGRYVVFTSFASNLVAGSNTKQQVYVKDTLSGLVTLASVDATGAAGNDGSSAPSLSGNGHAVAFVSLAANFSPLSTSHTSQVFVRDLELGTTTLESVTSSGAIVASKASTSPALSFDGHYVAFETQAALDSRDRDGASTWLVYLRDRTRGTTVLASLSPNTVAGSDSRAPSISADGRWVGFHSI